MFHLCFWCSPVRGLLGVFGSSDGLFILFFWSWTNESNRHGMLQLFVQELSKRDWTESKIQPLARVFQDVSILCFSLLGNPWDIEHQNARSCTHVMATNLLWLRDTVFQDLLASRARSSSSVFRLGTEGRPLFDWSFACTALSVPAVKNCACE